MASTMKEFLENALNEAKTSPFGKQAEHERKKEVKVLKKELEQDCKMLEDAMLQSNQALVVKTYTGRIINTIKNFEKRLKKLGIE